MPQKHPDLVRIYNTFGLSSNHKLSTLLANIENCKHFADLLHAVEREFFMVPGEPSGEPEDEGAPVDDECLVNSWGSTTEQYIKQFRAALDRLQGQSRTITLSGCEFTEHELVGRAVRAVSGTSRYKTPRWALMKDAFGCGSGVATALCRRFNLNPDEELRR
ncbi:hypothetical protein QEP73_13740 [Pseudomonas defluvii]|nr:hypothetical protein QEP73_13740 [Pseudomonas defluvii]